MGRSRPAYSSKLGNKPISGFSPLRVLRTTRTGTTVAARRDSGSTLFAVHWLTPTITGDFDAMRQLRTDVAQLRGTNQPGLVEYSDLIETADGVAVVCELIEGVTLADVLSQDPWPVDMALVLVCEVLEALAWAHHRGVMHRNVSPDTILIDSGGRVRLLGTGVAAPIFQPNLSPGTPDYMAPELWNELQSTIQSDLYAVAAVLYQLLSGHPPFAARRLAALRAHHLRTPVALASVPTAFHELLSLGLAKDPGDRPPSAVAFRESVRGAAEAAAGAEWRERGGQKLAALALSGSSEFPSALISGMSESEVPSALPWRRRAAVPLLLGAAILALALIGFAGVVASRHSANPGAVLSTAPPPATPSPTHPVAQTAAAQASTLPPSASPSPSASPTVRPSVPAIVWSPLPPTPKPTPTPTSTPTATPTASPSPSASPTLCVGLPPLC